MGRALIFILQPSSFTTMPFNNLHDTGATPANTLEQLLHLGTGSVTNGTIRTGAGALTPLSFVDGELAVAGQIQALGIPVFRVLGGDLSTSTTSGVAIGDFDFVPVAGASYPMEMFLVCMSAATGTGVQISASGASGSLSLFDPASANRLDLLGQSYAPTSSPVANASFGCQLAGLFEPSGTQTLSFQLKSEVGGSTVQLKAGSVLKITRVS